MADMISALEMAFAGPDLLPIFGSTKTHLYPALLLADYNLYVIKLYINICV